MRKISAIIIDDEKKAGDNLAMLLSNFCPQVNVLAYCANVNEARMALLQHDPELVFLDIHMPGGSGFDLLGSIKNKSFEVIFTTAYDEFAIKAFEHHAVGYLLKPILSKQLIESVERAEQYLGDRNSTYKDLLETLGGGSQTRQMALPVSDGLELMSIDKILWFKASGSYTTVFLEGGSSRTLVKNLKSIEKMLTKEPFFRIHHSYLVNLKHVLKVLKKDGGFVQMSDGTELEISRRKKTEMLEFLQKQGIS